MTTNENPYQTPYKVGQRVALKEDYDCKRTFVVLTDHLGGDCWNAAYVLPNGESIEYNPIVRDSEIDWVVNSIGGANLTSLRSGDLATLEDTYATLFKLGNKFLVPGKHGFKLAFYITVDTSLVLPSPLSGWAYASELTLAGRAVRYY